MPDIPVDLTQCAGGNCAKVAANGKSTGGADSNVLRTWNASKLQNSALAR